MTLDHPDALGRWLGEMRPRLHRHCARMMGSAFDGEDVVQDALAKASEAWPGAGRLEHPERWMFRIAHNAALDALRRRRRQPKGSAEELAAMADETAAADARVAATAGLASFLGLPAAQRACVALTDVLGHSLAETSEVLDMSVAAVKAALHRGRRTLRARAAQDAAAPPLDPAERERLRAYADRFNARDFDALRALLAEDVRLDLVDRVKLAGREDVAVYFARYDGASDWRFAVGVAEGRLVLLVSDPADPDGGARYVVLLDWKDGEIAAIRDFKYASYVMEALAPAPL